VSLTTKAPRYLELDTSPSPLVGEGRGEGKIINHREHRVLLHRHSPTCSGNPKKGFYKNKGRKVFNRLEDYSMDFFMFALSSPPPDQLKGMIISTLNAFFNAFYNRQ
jgi:hypothetical protein